MIWAPVGHSWPAVHEAVYSTSPREDVFQYTCVAGVNEIRLKISLNEGSRPGDVDQNPWCPGRCMYQRNVGFHQSPNCLLRRCLGCWTCRSR